MSSSAPASASASLNSLSSVSDMVPPGWRQEEGFRENGRRFPSVVRLCLVSDIGPSRLVVREVVATFMALSLGKTAGRLSSLRGGGGEGGVATRTGDVSSITRDEMRLLS